MSGSTLISVHVSSDIVQRLADLANTTEHSKSYLVEQALEEYLAHHEWQVRAIQHGVQQADTGKLVEHTKALKVLSKWRKRGA